MNRLQDNLEIISVLKQEITNKPDLRFFQLLYNLGIEEVTTLYHEESATTLARLTSQWDSSTPVESKEQIEINRLKEIIVKQEQIIKELTELLSVKKY